MSDANSRLPNGTLLCLMLVSLLLAGCSGSDGLSAAPQVVITPSATEGAAPLTVTFDVGGTNFVTGADWDFGDGSSAATFGQQSISHTFEAPGVMTVSVDVSLNPPSNVQTVEIPITVLGVNGEIDTPPDDEEPVPPNLVVSSFAIDDEVTPGGHETISAIIQNLGPGTLEGYGVLHVGYYLSTDEVITVDDILIGDTTINLTTNITADSEMSEDEKFGLESLSPGGFYAYDHPLAITDNVPAGTYYAGAIVDYIDEYHWYTFPRATDTLEYEFPVHVVVAESNEDDNVRLLNAHQVTVNGLACADDAFEPDNSSDAARTITVGEMQTHNFCHDNSDWLQFDAVEGNVYKITTGLVGPEVDTQLILYAPDGVSILLFNDNILHNPFPTACGLLYTVDLECDWPPVPESEIVWEALQTGTYLIKVRTTKCDEDKDDFCDTVPSPDGAGLETTYTVTLQ